MTEKNDFAQKVLDYHFSLSHELDLPEGVELLYPYDEEDTRTYMRAFYEKYYSDDKERILLLGINPGRFGAGRTGIPFTDPVNLERVCGIDNELQKKHELSSIFIYDIIEAYGGPADFFSDFYISSTSPLGFLKDGKNYNYYDDRELLSRLEPFIKRHLISHEELPLAMDIVFSLGKGRNFKELLKLNRGESYFGNILPLPHPRWVMQYRRKMKDEFVVQIVEMLLQVKGER